VSKLNKYVKILNKNVIKKEVIKIKYFSEYYWIQFLDVGGERSGLSLTEVLMISPEQSFFNF
jgi:hypothetical protein